MLVMLGNKLPIAALINLNHPQHYFSWSFLSISIANLVIILTMIIIFGLALYLPFPKAKLIKDNHPETDLQPTTDQDADTKKMLTYKARTYLTKILPPYKLIPDSQPIYVASWIYVFGVATLVALGVVIVSGMVLAIGGVNWWHQSSLGHFFNSMHLWSVELFMSFMVIHLWGKFWMAAWRGKRTLTWMTGVLAFLISILEAFTGYLSQQNFDSQWIATNGKDAVNAVGLGSFFNLMNFGQMITWHIVLIPLALVAIVVFHIILVRVKGVVKPIDRSKDKTRQKLAKMAEAKPWKGPNRRYDIIKEGSIAAVIVLALVIILATLLSSPDKPPVTIQTWAKVAPADFIATADSELAGTSETAQYGPPYNHNHQEVQSLGGVSWQMLAGVHQPINSARTFVLDPLSTIAFSNPKLAKSLKQYESAPKTKQQLWNSSYQKAVKKVIFKNNNPIIPKAKDGPVPYLINTELAMARSGALDTDLLTQQQFYGTNYTKPLLFIEDGNYFSSIATAEHMNGTQWGVMNESGSYPGQPWLWLYTLWYQVPSFSSSLNVDLIAIYLTAIATFLLIMVPLLPGIRSIPKVIPVYKIIWRKWYKGKL